MRFFCDTKYCLLLSAQLHHAWQTIATLRELLDAAIQERDDLAAQLAAERAARATEHESMNFYMDLFLSERERKWA